MPTERFAMTSATPTDSDAPMPRTLQIGWAFGAAGSTTILYLVNVLFLYFMVAHLGIAPAVAGSLLLFARIYDAVADIVIGTFSDRTRSRWGRRRPWMAGGAALGTIGMACLFLPTLAPGVVGPQTQIMIILVVLFTGYSAFAIPSSAMATEMTTSYQGRTSLMAYRTFFIQAAALVGSAAAPAMVAWGGGSTSAYIGMGFAMASFVAVSMGTAVMMTAGARETAQTSHQLPSLQRFVSVLGNRPFLVLLGAKFFGFIAAAAFGAAGLFFMRDVIQRGEAGMSQLGLISAISGMASVVLWRWIARFVRKEQAYAVALMLNVVASLSWLIATPDEPDMIFYVRAACMGLASTGTVLMALSILPDAIEHDFHRTGLRREGVYAALFEFFQKAAFAIGPFFVGLFLEANGYRAATGGIVQQSAAATEAVRLTLGVLPAVAYAGAIVLLIFFYRLPRHQGGQA